MKFPVRVEEFIIFWAPDGSEQTLNNIRDSQRDYILRIECAQCMQLLERLKESDYKDVPPGAVLELEDMVEAIKILLEREVSLSKKTKEALRMASDGISEALVELE